MSDMLENEKVPQNLKTCPVKGIQDSTVCLPVKVSPFAVTGPVKLQCCGKPVVMPPCHCHGKVNGCCEFTITQKIRVEIPVVFGATVNTGETFVECGCVKGEGSGEDCGCAQEDEDEE